MNKVSTVAVFMLSLGASFALSAEPIGEIRMNDGKTYLIAGFIPKESASDYFIRHGQAYMSLADVRELVRIDSGLSNARYYQVTMVDGNWRDFSSNVFLFRRVAYRDSHGERAETLVPVLKDRGSDGFWFIAATGRATADRYVEIANPGEISEIRFFTPSRYAQENSAGGLRDASLGVGIGE